MAFSWSDAWRNRNTGGSQTGTVTTQPTTEPTPAKPPQIAIPGATINDRYAEWMRERDANGWKPRMVDWYQREAESNLGMGETEAKRLRDLEEARGARAEGMIGSAVSAANVPTMTDQDIRRSFGRSTDDASKGMMGQMGSLRSYLGGAGITGGGLAAGMAAQFQLARAGQMTDARRALFLEKSKTDALDRARNFQNQLTYASAVNRPVSMLYSDWLGQSAGIRLGQSGVERQYMAGKAAADAQKDAGLMSGIGGIAGGLIGAIL